MDIAPTAGHIQGAEAQVKKTYLRNASYLTENVPAGLESLGRFI